MAQILTVFPRWNLQGVFRQIDLAEQRLGFIGTKVLPFLRTDKQNGTYPVYPRANMTKVQSTMFGPKSGFSRSEGQMDNASYDCLLYGHEVPVFDTQRDKYAGMWDLEADAADECMDKVLRDRENRIAVAMQDTGTITTTAAATAAWSDGGNARPIADILSLRNTIKLNSGTVPDVAIMTDLSYQYLIQTDDIREVVKYTSGNPPPMSQVAAALALKEIIVSGSIKNTGEDGAAFAGASMWDSTKVTLAKLCAPSNTLDKNPGIGRTFVWTGMGTGDMGVVEQYRWEPLLQDIVRVRMACVEKIMDPLFGGILTGC